MYEALSINEILKQAQKHPGLEHYFPDRKDMPRLPRQWIINVLHTILEREFADWVHGHIEKRNSNRAAEQQLMIDLDPEVARHFQESTFVSSR